METNEFKNAPRLLDGIIQKDNTPSFPFFEKSYRRNSAKTAARKDFRLGHGK